MARLPYTKGTNSWIFVKGNKMTSKEGRKTTWIYITRSNPSSNRSKRVAQITRDRLEGGTHASPTSCIYTRGTCGPISSKAGFMNNYSIKFLKDYLMTCLRVRETVGLQENHN